MDEFGLMMMSVLTVSDLGSERDALLLDKVIIKDFSTHYTQNTKALEQSPKIIL